MFFSRKASGSPVWPAPCLVSEDAGHEVLLTTITPQELQFLCDQEIVAMGSLHPRDAGLANRLASDFALGRGPVGTLNLRLTGPAPVSGDSIEPMELPLREGAIDTQVEGSVRVAALLQAAKSNIDPKLPARRVQARLWAVDELTAQEVKRRLPQPTSAGNTLDSYANGSESIAVRLVNLMLQNDQELRVGVKLNGDRLSGNSTQLTTFSTLVEVVNQRWESLPTTSQQFHQMARFMHLFWSHLRSVQPAFDGYMPAARRVTMRQTSPIGTTTLLHGIIGLANACHIHPESDDALDPMKKLRHHSASFDLDGTVHGFFSLDENPDWERHGVATKDDSGSWTVRRGAAAQDAAIHMLLTTCELR